MVTLPACQGDVALVAGDSVVVTKKEGEWWFGLVNDGEREGYFPFSYVG